MDTASMASITDTVKNNGYGYGYGTENVNQKVISKVIYIIT